jgi:hypothetical protein
MVVTENKYNNETIKLSVTILKVWVQEWKALQFPLSVYQGNIYVPSLGPTQFPNQWILRDLSRKVKRPGCEADHSHLSSTEVNKAGVISPLPNTSSLRGTSLIKFGDNFNFTLRVFRLSMGAADFISDYVPRWIELKVKLSLCLLNHNAMKTYFQLQL